MIKSKKGDIEMYVIFIAVLIFAGYLLIAVLDIGNEVELIGQTSLKLVNSFEASERVFFYIDASAEISANEAKNELLGNAGFISQVFKGKQEGQKCGITIYPLLNEGEDVEKCLPNYKNAFITAFRKNFNFLILKYEPFPLDPYDFEVFFSSSSRGLSLKVVALSDLEMPIYSYIESYYADADKTRTQTSTSSDLYTENEYGYLERKGLISHSRGDGVVSKVVLHDTKESSIISTYDELSKGHRNYHYVIDTDGKIYQFAPEERKTSHSDCVKSDNQGCQIEDIDKESISIAFVGCSPGNPYCYKNLFNQPTPLLQAGNEYSEEQVLSLKNLIAEIAIRNDGFVIERQNIILSREVDTNLDDPKDELVMIMNNIVLDAKRLYDQKKTGVSPPSGGGNQITGGVTAITGMVVPPGIKSRTPITGVKTTVYFTPDVGPEKDWCSTTNNGCFTRAEINPFYGGSKTQCLEQRKGFCCINNEDRGFYEEVKCQGSGRYNGKVYHTDSITTSSNSPWLEGFENGITSKGIDPKPKRTVAADPKCYPYYTKMYIYFGDGNPWNGYYQVEDTGSAFNNCYVMDIYAGVGRQAVNEAEQYVSGKHPQIYILDDNFRLPDLDFTGTAGVVQAVAGTYYTRYSKNVEVPSINNIFESTFEFAKETVRACYNKQTLDERRLCVEDKANTSLNDFGVNVTIGCELMEVETQKINSISGSEATILGKIKDVSDIKEDSQFSSLTNTVTKTKYVEMEVEDDTGSVDIKFVGDAVKLFEFDETVEQVNIPQKGEVVIINMNNVRGTWTVDVPENIEINPGNVNMNSLINIGKKLSDCATSSSTCECEVSFEGFSKTLSFNKEKISFDENYADEATIQIPVTVYKDEASRTSKITGFSAKMEDYADGLHFTVYSDKTAVLKASAGSTAACIPTRETHLFCASIDDENVPEDLKFSLKI